jgi:hypothetical protein
MCVSIDLGGVMRGAGGQPPQKRQATGAGVGMPQGAQLIGGMSPMGVQSGGAGGALGQQGAKPPFMNVPPGMANQQVHGATLAFPDLSAASPIRVAGSKADATTAAGHGAATNG